VLRNAPIVDYNPVVFLAPQPSPIASGPEDAPEANPPDAIEDPEILDIERIPQIEVLPRVAYKKKEDGLPEAERAAGQPIDWSRGPVARWSSSFSQPASASVVISVHLNHPDRHSAQGWLRFFQTNPEVPAMTANCGYGADTERPVDSYTLARRPDGSFHYVHMHAWLNYATCKGLLLRSFDAPVVPIAGGLGYAYRSRCPRCKPGETESLHVITASMDRGNVTADRGKFQYWTSLIDHIEIPIDPGTGSTLTAQFSSETVARWKPVAPRPLPTRPMSLRMEVTRAASERAATALVWVR
jgi:hypothetical protein